MFPYQFFCHARLLSISLLALCLLSSLTHSHEIRPAITDIHIRVDGQLDIAIRGNLETWLAGIGPEHQDTRDAPQSTVYEQLRRYNPAQLERAFERFTPTLLNAINLYADQQRLTLSVTAIEIPEVGNTAVARDTLIHLSTQVPASSAALRWQWAEKLGSNALRFSTSEQQDAYTIYLQPGDSSDPIPLQQIIVQSAGSQFLNYLIIGFEHIIPKGLDHILFVIGLFLLSYHWRPLLWQVSCFTLAHTVTLALGMLGIITLPPSIVEPLIAASIVYVAVENLFAQQLNRWRTILVFAFGLLHGLGFAGVLQEIGLRPDAFVSSLIAFNIGVELGQIAVLALCYLLLAAPFRQYPWYRQRITIPLSLVIALIASYWVIERTLLS